MGDEVTKYQHNSSDSHSGPMSPVNYYHDGPDGTGQETNQEITQVTKPEFQCDLCKFTAVTEKQVKIHRTVKHKFLQDQ